MASLEYIDYIPHRPIVDAVGQATWERDRACQSIDGLPQIFWSDGSPWLEANLYAHHRATNQMKHILTVKSNLGHLHKYAQWLEEQGLDWRHFPTLERDRVLIRWRKRLIELRDKYGLLASSTATERMSATVNFYKFAKAHDLISRDVPMWRDKLVPHRFHDTNGFERTMLLTSTDLAIPNRARHGLQLEGGLEPLTEDQMHQLLAFTGQKENASRELYLMLLLGFFTGARIQTITDLKRGTLDNAVPDPRVPGMFLLAVGPGHRPHVATKFNVQGRIMVPDWLLDELRAYVTDTARLKREVRAAPGDKDLIFLTKSGNRYADRNKVSGTAVDGAVLKMRKKATAAGMKFAEHFHFHMTRATFGTWLTSLLLSMEGITEKAVLGFVRDVMLHKNEADTLRYIRFVKETEMKIHVANEFSQAFLGLRTRLGDNHA